MLGACSGQTTKVHGDSKILVTVRRQQSLCPSANNNCTTVCTEKRLFLLLLADVYFCFKIDTQSSLKPASITAVAVEEKGGLRLNQSFVDLGIVVQNNKTSAPSTCSEENFWQKWKFKSIIKTVWQKKGCHWGTADQRTMNSQLSNFGFDMIILTLEQCQKCGHPRHWPVWG